jgi:hypothetical protein
MPWRAHRWIVHGSRQPIGVAALRGMASGSLACRPTNSVLARVRGGQCLWAPEAYQPLTTQRTSSPQSRAGVRSSRSIRRSTRGRRRSRASDWMSSPMF